MASDINTSEFGYIVVVRDRGQDRERVIGPKIYPDHVAATTVKHNLQQTGRYNTVFVRLATKEDRERWFVEEEGGDRVE